MASEGAITCQGLIKSYGNVKALLGVDLTVKCGEIFGFLGPNGAGKTTTIRCMLDLIRPDGGSLQVLGINPQKDPVAVRKRTGYLPGELSLEPDMSVEGVLRYFTRLRGGKTDWNYAKNLSDRLDLNLKTAIKNLSKGNKQKVGLVQALMHQPDLLLLDEPTIGLDPLMQQEVLHLVREAAQHGATVFFSSHILPEVQAVSDRVGFIRKGVVVEVAETQTLINRALRRVHIRLREPLDVQAITSIDGITLVRQDDDTSLTLQVAGAMDPLIKELALYPVIDFETERPSLEEIFLAYYEKEKNQQVHSKVIP